MQNNTYTTTHNTAERTMTISMKAGIKLTVDWKNESVITTRNGEQKDKKTFAEIKSLADFEKYIENAERAANQLSNK